MFELISRRYQNKSTLVTTNRPFAEWREVFPNAACVVSLIDRLVHNAEIVAIEGDPIASRKPTTAPSNAPAGAAPPSHDAACASAAAHRRYPPHLDTRRGARRVRTDR